jgi:hypothetical protein
LPWRAFLAALLDRKKAPRTIRRHVDGRLFSHCCKELPSEPALDRRAGDWAIWFDAELLADSLG